MTVFAMKVLIIKTFPTEGKLPSKILASYRSHIFTAHPNASIEICAAATGDALSDPYHYDLIIITGGTFDLLTRAPEPWVLNIMEMVRTVAESQTGTPKLLGICWGHQVIQKALGGQLGALVEGPRVRLKCQHIVQCALANEPPGWRPDL